MQGNKYKIYIKRNGNYLIIDELRSVQETSVKTEIKNAPDGWMQMVANVMRNKDYKGCFRKVSTPLKFTGDGKAILDYVAVYEGVNSNVTMAIEVQVPEGFSYEPFFEGTLNFKENYTYSRDFSETNIDEILAIDIINAKKDVVYSMPLNDDNSELIQMDGINLTYKSNFIVNEGNVSVNNYQRRSHIIGWDEVFSENPYTKTTVRAELVQFPWSLQTTHTQNWFLNPPVVGKTNISGRLKFQAKFDGNISALPVTARLLIQVVVHEPGISDSLTDFKTYVVYDANSKDNVYGVSGTKTHDFTFNLDIDVPIGHKAVMTLRHLNVLTNGTVSEVTYDTAVSVMNLSSVQRSPATLHRLIRPWRLWQELISKATGGKYSGVSPHLFNDQNLVLISGNSLRGDGEIVLQTKISDFLKFVWCLKRGVIKDIAGNNILIDDIATTYKNHIIADLGEVADFEWYFDNGDLISTIKTGYENIDFGVDGQINGRDEWNQTNYFTTGQEGIDGEYDLICPYVGSMYAQELLRVNFSSLKTTDNKGDNKVYIVDAEKGATVQYYSGAMQFIAPGTIRLAGSFDNINGRSITIAGAGAFSGTYTINNVSYVEVGFTIISTVQNVANGTSGGVITYEDANIWKPRRPVYASITGILQEGSAYNTEITPKDMLRLHGPIIGSGVYNINASDALDVIKFQSGDKNTKLSLSYDGIAFIKQDSDERFSQLQQPFALPIIFKFKTDYRKNIFSDLIGDHKYGLVNFEIFGIKLNGYIEDISSNADSGESQQWLLKSNVSANLVNLLSWQNY